MSNFLQCPVPLLPVNPLCSMWINIACQPNIYVHPHLIHHGYRHANSLVCQEQPTNPHLRMTLMELSQAHVWRSWRYNHQILFPYYLSNVYDSLDRHFMHLEQKAGLNIHLKQSLKVSCQLLTGRFPNGIEIHPKLRMSCFLPK